MKHFPKTISHNPNTINKFQNLLTDQEAAALTIILFELTAEIPELDKTRLVISILKCNCYIKLHLGEKQMHSRF